MSNHLAIATVTAALNESLQAGLIMDVPGSTVTTVRPDALSNGNQGGPKVNIYLYQVTPNAAWRNADLPTRRSDGTMVQRPQAGLDLHYLLSCYGDEAQYLPQRMLGSLVRSLHARPVLTRRRVRDAVSNASDYLGGSNLADAVELVKFTPISLSLEELSKLWSVFFQTPYALSVAYQATVVLIESEDTPWPVLPVRKPKLYVSPFRQPRIERAVSSQGQNLPVIFGETLIIEGRDLQGDITRVHVGGAELEPAAENLSNTRISLPLTDPALRAGAQGVQVVHQELLGDPPTPHRGVESNVTAIVLRPAIENLQTAVGLPDGESGRQLIVRLKPVTGPSQRVAVLLNGLAGGSTAVISAPPREQASDSLAFPLTGVGSGAYLVRVQVDGAETVLETDADTGAYTGPTVTIEPVMTASLAELTSDHAPPGNNYLVEGVVSVLDDKGDPLGGVAVSAEWQAPGGTFIPPEETTGAGGQATFSLTDDSGTFTLAITGLTLQGFVWDEAGSAPISQSLST